MNAPRRPRAVLQRMLPRAAVVLLTWALVLVATGGFYVETTAGRISSRAPSGPIVLALLCLLGALVSGDRGRRLAQISDALGDLNRIGHLWTDARLRFAAIGLIALATVAGALVFGARVAGGADSSVYLNQARMWSEGHLVAAEPLMGHVSWARDGWPVAPLGYRPALTGKALVPIYGPGLPITMAVAGRAFGPGAIYWVVPLLGGLAIWFTYRLGREFGGIAVGFGAAVLLAASPIFLYQLLEAPMSDVPAAAWWTAALALAVGPRRLSPAWSGLAAGAALATRPNLLPLLVVPASITFFTAHDRLAALKRTGVFVLGALPALAGVAMLNDYWYGSPFRSGYGDLGVLYAFGNAWPNLARYPVWLVQSQTPLVALALAGMAGTGTRAAGPASQIDPRVLGRGVLAFSLLTLGCYVFYVVYDAWWFLRFILPALPALLVLAVGATWRAVTTWLPRHAALAFALLLAVVGAQTLAFARSHGAFDARGRSEPYQELASVLVAKFPANAVFVARQYSGSIRYYTGRSIVRFDYLSPEELRGALAELKTLGYAPYVVLHDSEEAAFRERFRPGAPDAALRLEPMLSLGCCTTVYKPH